MQHLLELAVGPGEEVLDLLALHRRQRAGRGQLVDEEAVALVGGNASGRGVRLAQVARALQFGHQVTDHRGAHAERIARGDLLRADRLGGRYELLHCGEQH